MDCVKAGVRPVTGKRASALMAPVRGLRGAATAPGRWVDRLLPDGRSRALALRSLAVAAGVLAVAAIVLTVLTVRDSRTEAARIQGIAAAVELTPRLLSYDYRSLADDKARAEAAITGDFAAQYAQFTGQILSPNAAGQNFVTKATVRDAAQVSWSADEVVAVLFLDQATTSKALTAPRLDNVGVRVTLRDVDGTWLISGLDRL